MEQNDNPPSLLQELFYMYNMYSRPLDKLEVLRATRGFYKRCGLVWRALIMGYGNLLLLLIYPDQWKLGKGGGGQKRGNRT